MAACLPSLQRQTGSLLLRLLLSTALVAVLVAALAVGWLYLYDLQPGSVPEGAEVAEAVVVIPPGSSLQQIEEILAEAGLIYADRRFSLLARILGLAGEIPAGEFSLSTGLRPHALLQALVQAKPIQHPLTIPEGLRLTEIAARFAAGGWCSEEDFMRRAADPDLIRSLGLGELESLEGYFYPDTYNLTRGGHDVDGLITMMVRRFQVIWDSLERDGQEGLSRHEVVILASVVEKETGKAAERPLIAGVFHNRLARKMRLQTDPTVIYGIKDFDGNITRKHLREYTPYNTYVIPGLPAGPIASPGRAALQAVLKPQPSEYLYFVSKKDGSHYFSKTLAEHNRAVRKYQLGR
ncbi:MAG: endolytic transglycosylase MltG [Desulfobulbaceae bacterium]|uniref:Endolytic murein transglycosylase n=1 Tax=Candidatus Desulfatifera sulfidica TaxID=2841691 RepID=A0A8J6NCB4_9BACT|nr:endolytic transglycosylase MltG [Candidatus Desulfatifera sulfidica]